MATVDEFLESPEFVESCRETFEMTDTDKNGTVETNEVPLPPYSRRVSTLLSTDDLAPFAAVPPAADRAPQAGGQHARGASRQDEGALAGVCVCVRVCLHFSLVVWSHGGTPRRTPRGSCRSTMRTRTGACSSRSSWSTARRR